MRYRDITIYSNKAISQEDIELETMETIVFDSMHPCGTVFHKEELFYSPGSEEQHYLKIENTSHCEYCPCYSERGGVERCVGLIIDAGTSWVRCV